MSPSFHLLIIEEDLSLRMALAKTGSRLTADATVAAVSCPSEVSPQVSSTQIDLVYVGLTRSASGWTAALADLQQGGRFAGAVLVVDACRSPERLARAFDSFVEGPARTTGRLLDREDRLAVPVANRIALVKVADICWIEGAGKYVRIHTRGKVYLLRELLQDLEARLDSSRFIRIHRSTIVNVDCIATLEHAGRGEYLVHLGDGAELKLTRSYRSHLHTLTGGLVGDPPLAARPRDSAENPRQQKERLRHPAKGGTGPPYPLEASESASLKAPQTSRG